MKKILCILFIFIMVFSLGACNSNTDIDIEPAKTNISKDGVDEFMSILEAETATNDSFDFEEENCYNVTPEEILEETDMQIFKFSDSCYSFLMSDGKIYSLCEFFGGYGFVDALPCDFNNDNKKDLLVASSWGSGMHRGEISVFQSGNVGPTVIFDTSSGETLYTDLALEMTPLSVFTGKKKDTDLVFGVWGVEVNSENDNLADLTVEYLEPVGYVKNENNRAVFVLAD
ncbi:MAG: hypothetical protein IKK10_04440 [Clostridia bacterium]|nr:hypothetical protein [Clostridia bacterium]